MPEVEDESKNCEPVVCATKRTEVAVSEDDANSNKASHSVERCIAKETDLQHQTLPIVTNVNSKPLTADCKLNRTENTTSNINVKDSSADESVVDYVCSTPLVSKLSSSQPLDLPEPVVDFNTEMSSSQPSDTVITDNISQPRTLETMLPEQQDSTQGFVKSTLVTDNNHTAELDYNQGQDTVETDRPSTVITISTHRDKDISTLCQPDSNCANGELTGNSSQPLPKTNKVPQNVADLHMCCSDDDTSATESVKSCCKQNETAESSLTESQNENDKISDDMSETNPVLLRKQTANGMAFLCDYYYYWHLITHLAMINFTMKFIN